ncbi:MULTISPECIES: LysR family transcriptional regulator [unclassified Janthinobacterium]|uniref:LysR family transcriptional regulator n=1 Tax=unclassified Janthinobacterium TaxID=2610881 RepID=UPI001615BC37|nr:MULTISPECIES: LysR family transcriptional regulator [unclassified Janthinobacterium]MBB5608777.1 DNA-binding transcriptional LysR family regulator [Janthinobacterium sp. S3T4]MBB5613820.1 DNA-binding transcriptional LysR family regulator [Janthinobacterium sp. S3M3]
MDRLEAMNIFLAVVDAGSLSAAARQLDMPLATVSRKVAALEAHLKTRLLHRTTRKLVLTEAGTSYVAACRRILEDISEVERTASGEYATPKGELTVTASVVFGRLHIVPVVAEFLAQYPEIEVNLVLTDRVMHLMDEPIDVAVRIGELPDSSFMAARVGAVRRVICASPAYLARHGTPATPADLAKHDCISFEVLESRRAWVFGTARSPLSVPVHSRLSVNTVDAAIAAATLGVGLIRVLSYQVMDGLRDGTLQVVLEDFESEPLPVSLMHKGQAPLPLKLRAFLDFATPRLRARQLSARLSSA